MYFIKRTYDLIIFPMEEVKNRVILWMALMFSFLWKNNINRMALNRRKKHKMEMVTKIALKYIGLCASVSVIIYLGSVKCISTEIKSEQSGLISEHYHISPSLDELRYKGYLKTMYINVIYKTLNFIKS